MKQYADIERDVVLLKESMEIIQTLVHEQQESLDTIEEFIIMTKNDIKKAETTLHVSSVYTTPSYTMYVSGAIGIIGTIIGLIVLF